MHAGILRTGLGVLCLIVLSSAAVGEEVKLSDLEGMRVDAKFTRHQVVRRAGREFPVTIEGSWKIEIKPDRQLDVIFNATAHTPRGKRQAEPTINTVTLDETRETQIRGRGKRIWTFADGTLTFTRTFPAGAYRINFAFANGAD